MTMTPELKEFTSREFQKVPQIAKLVKLSRNKVYDAINAGELPARMFGTAKRVRTADALKWAGIPYPGTAEQDAEGEK